MKKIGILILMFISLVSCSNDNNSDDTSKYIGTDYYGKWININNNGEWSDQYVFNKDNTFTRAKKIDGVTINLSGTFEIFTREDRPNFQLTYSAPSNLIYNCSTGFGSTSELLYIHNGYLENSAEMCDFKVTYQKDK